MDVWLIRVDSGTATVEPHTKHCFSHIAFVRGGPWVLECCVCSATKEPEKYKPHIYIDDYLEEER